MCIRDSPKGLDLIEGNNAFAMGSNRRMMGIDNTLRGSVLPIVGFGIRRNGGILHTVLRKMLKG